MWHSEFWTNIMLWFGIGVGILVVITPPLVKMREEAASERFREEFIAEYGYDEWEKLENPRWSE